MSMRMSMSKLCKNCGESIHPNMNGNWAHVGTRSIFCGAATSLADPMAEPCDAEVAPDMVSVIAAALSGHEAELDTSGDCYTGYCTCNQKVPYVDHAAHQARAVLDAISEAGAVEWGVFRKSDALAAGAFDEAIFKTKAAADAFIKLGFLPHVVERVEPRSRLTFPWTPTVAWGVSYKGRVYPYESEDEARRQLRLAQMDVPAMLVTKVGDGEWVEVEG